MLVASNTSPSPATAQPAWNGTSRSRSYGRRVRHPKASSVYLLSSIAPGSHQKTLIQTGRLVH
jgi:hypothetical protein